MTKFFYLKPISRPEEVREYLTSKHHWRRDHSAYELSTSWIGAGDVLPARVREVLDTVEEYRGGSLIDNWNVSTGKQRRLESLCDLFDLDVTSVGHLRYQLFHRTASAVFEAQRYGADQAMLLIHSFSRNRTSFADYRAFAEALGVDGADVGHVSTPRTVGGVELQIAWIDDAPSRTLSAPK